MSDDANARGGSDDPVGSASALTSAHEMSDGTMSDGTADADLVRSTRDGDTAAYSELWRRHYGAGVSAARAITAKIDADDLVQEAYTRIFQAIQRGGGPTGSFRSYLFSTIRNAAASWGRTHNETPIDEMDVVADPATTEQATEEALDRNLTARAFRSLPTRWQEVLWYTEIEQMKPAQVAPLLGLKPVAVSQLASRAREGLREAWISAHLASLDDGSDCHWVSTRMGAYARGTTSRRDQSKIEGHLVDCARCTTVAAEAHNVSSRLTLVLLPLTVGVSAAAGYLATLQGGGVSIAALAAGASPVMPGAVLGGSELGAGAGAAATGAPQTLHAVAAGAQGLHPVAAASVGAGGAGASGSGGAAAGSAGSGGTGAAGSSSTATGIATVVGIAAAGVLIAGAAIAGTVMSNMPPTGGGEAGQNISQNGNLKVAIEQTASPSSSSTPAPSDLPSIPPTPPPVRTTPTVAPSATPTAPSTLPVETETPTPTEEPVVTPTEDTVEPPTVPLVVPTPTPTPTPTSTPTQPPTPTPTPTETETPVIPDVLPEMTWAGNWPTADDHVFRVTFQTPEQPVVGLVEGSDTQYEAQPLPDDDGRVYVEFDVPPGQYDKMLLSFAYLVDGELYRQEPWRTPEEIATPFPQIGTIPTVAPPVPG